jgi:hypothetical protein
MLQPLLFTRFRRKVKRISLKIRAIAVDARAVETNQETRGGEEDLAAGKDRGRTAASGRSLQPSKSPLLATSGSGTS